MRRQRVAPRVECTSHNRLQIRGCYRSTNTAGAVGWLPPFPFLSLPADVISCPMAAPSPLWDSSCGCFIAPQRPRPGLSTRWDPDTAELMFPGQQHTGKVEHDINSQQNCESPVAAATRVCHATPSHEHLWTGRWEQPAKRSIPRPG